MNKPSDQWYKLQKSKMCSIEYINGKKSIKCYYK